MDGDKLGLSLPDIKQPSSPTEQDLKVGKAVPKLNEKGKEKIHDTPPFDFKFIKILINKKDKKTIEEIMIDRAWVSKNNNVPHFANVVKTVDPSEGVEITMNCNSIAFHWIIEFVKVKSNGDDLIEKRSATPQGCSSYDKEVIKNENESLLYEKMDEINVDNCLNILVTSFFL